MFLWLFPFSYLLHLVQCDNYIWLVLFNTDLFHYSKDCYFKRFRLFTVAICHDCDFLGRDSVPHRWILTLWRHMLPPSPVVTWAGSYRQAVAHQICEVEKGDRTHSKSINSYVHCFYWFRQHFICSSPYPTYTTRCILTFANEGSTFLWNVHVHHKTTQCHNPNPSLKPAIFFA